MHESRDAAAGRVKEILGILGPLYPDRTPLLTFETPFQLLVATVLAAQCMDAIVNTVTPTLFGRFPGPAALAAAPLGEVQSIIKPVSFFRMKSHNIKALSRMIDERYGGDVPASMEALCTLPGVGRKTAGTVLAHIFGRSAIIVDTHFARVSRRLGLTTRAKSEADKIEKDIAAITDESDWTELSTVLNRFGRAACQARRPRCDECPVRRFCVGP